MANEKAIAGLMAHLAMQPDDTDARLILADALEEDGQVDRADLQRQMAGYGILVPCGAGTIQELRECEYGRYEDLADEEDPEGPVDMPAGRWLMLKSHRGWLGYTILMRRGHYVLVRCEQDIEELLFALTTGTIDLASPAIKAHATRLTNRLHELVRRLR